MTTRYRDLQEMYSKHMEHHAIGTGLFIPVSARDLTPPCCGFFDRNGDWNLISKISSKRSEQSEGFEPLKEPLTQVTDILIKWQPKTSSGVTESAIDTSAATPQNVAGGADAHIKYSSSSKFGAVLMTKEPVTLLAYHQERLFTHWLESNRRHLHHEYGPQLRRYGCWIITKTYSTPGCSVNAWLNNDKAALVSIKAKASMLGELGSQLTAEDNVIDKDWSHYSAHHPGEGVVVFVDGIEVKPSEWWWRGLMLNLPLILRSPSSESNGKPRAASHPVIAEHAKRVYDPENTLTTTTPEKPVARHLSVPYSEPAHDLYTEKPRGDDEDHDVLQDAGLLQFSRASSLRRSPRPASIVSAVSAISSRTPSLRRETRSISEEHKYAASQ